MFFNYLIYKNQSNEKSRKENFSTTKKVAKQTEKLKNEIYSICENLDYQNSSRFSYNIDRLEQFNNELQDFKIITNDNK